MRLVAVQEQFEHVTAAPDTVTLGTDLSTYDQDLLQGNGPQELYDLGFREHIVSSHNADISCRLIERLRQFGHSINCLYCGIAGTAFGTKEIAHEIAMAMGIQYCALDCESYEDQPTDTTEAQNDYLSTREWLGARGITTLRYSGYSYWVNTMGSLDIGDAWWLPNYGAYSGVQPPPDPITHVVLNGVEIPIVIHQYSSLPGLAGRDARDRDYFIAPPWRSQVTQPSNEEVMQTLKALNEAIMKRLNLMEVATGDYNKMLEAWQLMLDHGFVQPLPTT